MTRRAQAETAWLATAPDLTSPSPLPAHQRIERWLTSELGRGTLVPGDRLPPEDTLAMHLGVSRMTLRQALATLEGRGTVTRRRGRGGGTFVAEPRFECDLTGLAGFTEQMRRSQVRVGARVVDAHTVPATAAVASGLSITAGDDVHQVVRVRTARREPLALERSWFPASLFPDLLQHPLSGSLYRLLERDYGRAPHTADERLAAVAAEPADADRLRVTAGAPLMEVERSVYDASGAAVEYARDLFRPDRVSISLRTAVGSDRRAGLRNGPARSSGRRAP